MKQERFGEILTKLMKECYLDDVTLSKKIDIPVPTIARLRNSKTANPTIATLTPIANFFNVSIDELIGRTKISPTRIPGTHIEIKQTSSFLPIIPWQDIQSFVSNEHSLQQRLTKFASTELKVQENSFFTQVATDSFGLVLKKNSFLLITNDKNCKDGDLVILKKRNKEIIVPQQIICDSDMTYIKSVNPNIKRIKTLTDDYEVLGKILEIRFNLTEQNNTTPYKKTSIQPHIKKETVMT